MHRLRSVVLVLGCLTGGCFGLAQSAVTAAAPGSGAPPPRQGRGPAMPVSPQIGSDGRVTFRIFAPQATVVTLAGDINQGLKHASAASLMPGALAPGIPMAKGPDGVWTGTSAEAMKPGAWRYHFMVDGMTVADVANVNTSPYQARIESLVIVPGDFSETREVPHGVVSRVRYISSRSNRAMREMYVYTPPGYEKGTDAYPVLYLIHGGAGEGNQVFRWYAGLRVGR